MARYGSGFHALCPLDSLLPQLPIPPPSPILLVSQDSKKIVLYDIPGKPGSRAWSPTTWKARLILNYKSIPYRTEWVSFPDIEPTFKSLGIKETKTKPDGQKYYSCPAIIDYTVTPEVKVADSNVIAMYLDDKHASEKQYGPRLFPEGTVDAQFALLDRFRGFLRPMGNLIAGCTPALLEDPRGAAYYSETRLQLYGRPLSDVFPAGSAERAGAWDALRKGLDALAIAFDENKEGGGEFAFGNAVTYVDIALAAAFLWTRYTPIDRDGPGIKCVWDEIKMRNGGRWEKFMEKFENHLQVV
ncbi:hypothetical protein FRB97_001144 [Tulasnella sp. 331]|nr:hypothetical protein FRB97_001144 [Tulasnella sp. 331]